jgi:dihydroorotate dehydrogenase
MFATSFQRWAYRYVAKPVFFRMDPELVHDLMLSFGGFLGNHGWTRRLAKGLYHHENSALEQEILGIRFPNPVGLAAGFDKNAELTQILPAVGFGFEEIGSITGEPCAGNPKPRLWRLPKSRGLVVYYGLKNDGCEAISKRLRGRKFDFPVGVSVAKTNNQATCDTEVGIADYVKAMRTMEGIGDYFAVNVSCPNAFGGKPFSTPEKLDALLTALDKVETAKPIFIKLAVDLSPAELDDLVRVADHHRVHGFILCNLTKRRDIEGLVKGEIAGIESGAISGKVIERDCNELISHLYKTAGSRYKIIGVGGVFSAEDAYEKIRRGTSLVQLITGMIFEGPQLIGEINRGLMGLLRRDGFKNVGEAVGSAHREAKG